MARNDVINSDGSINYNTIGGFKERLDGHDTSLAQKISQGDLCVNVKMSPYNAKGDGVTDDSVAIQNAINSGSPVYVPQGTYLVKNIVIPSYLVLYGAGVEKTIFKLPNSANSVVFISQNFSTLTGGNTTGGVSGVLLKDFTIDGNKANNPSGGWCLQKYGYRWQMQNVTFKNSATGGLYSEWSTNANAGTDGDFMEDMISNLRVHDNNGMGIQWRGPHDSRMSYFLVYNNTGVGISIEGSSTYGAAGIMMNHVHVYGSGSSGIQTLGTGAQANILGNMIESESNSGDGLLLNTNQNQIIGGSFYNNQNGVEIASNASGNVLQFQAQNNTYHQLALTADGGNNIIQASTWNGAGGQASMTGTVNTTTILQITGTGSGTPAQQMNVPGILVGTNNTRFYGTASGNGTQTVFTFTLSTNSPFSALPYLVCSPNIGIGCGITNISNTQWGNLTATVTFASAPPSGTNNVAVTFMIMA